MAEIIHFHTRRPLLPKPEVLAKMQEYVERLEEIEKNDVILRTVGRMGELARRHIRVIQEDWARLRSAAPHIHNEDPEVEALRLRFAEVVRKTLH